MKPVRLTKQKTFELAQDLLSIKPQIGEGCSYCENPAMLVFHIDPKDNRGENYCYKCIKDMLQYDMSGLRHPRRFYCVLCQKTQKSAADPWSIPSHTSRDNAHFECLYKVITHPVFLAHMNISR